MRGPLFSGALFRHIVEELEREAGHDETWRAVGELSEEERSECLDVLAIRWVHASTSVALVKKVAERSNRSARELHDLVIGRAAERVFTTIWRVILVSLVSPEAMILRVPVIFRRTYRGIETEAALESPGRATIRIRGWPAMDECSLHGIAVSTGVALRLAAKRAVSVSGERLTDGARYNVAWKP